MVNTDTFHEEDGHVSRCDDTGRVDPIRCPVCKGRGTVPYTYGLCTACNGRKQVWGCFKHRVFCRIGHGTRHNGPPDIRLANPVNQQLTDLISTS
jgi:hypothetical protein